MVAAAMVVVAGACGGDAESSTSTQVTSTSTSNGTESGDDLGADEVIDTLPRPDADWASAIITAYDDFLDGDLDRNLAFLDAVDADPEREVELFAEYLRTLSDAMSDLIGRFPDVPADSDTGRAALDLQVALEDRRDELDTMAAELGAIAVDVQADLDAGDDARYAEWRRRLVDDPSVESCFALQTELDPAGLGLLRCIPGPEGAPTDADPAAGPSGVELGPGAVPLTIELESDPDADEPTGTFEVTAGSTALGCRSGTWTDTDLSSDMVELTKELTCSGGENIGVITLTEWQDGSDAWLVIDATDGLAGLLGTGSFAYDPTTGIETLTGRFTL